MWPVTVRVGSVELANPVMTASGTAGYGTELAGYLDLAALGAVVVKSLAAYEWAGNPAPRLLPTGRGMLNAVGLQGPGVAALARPRAARTSCVPGRPSSASIWGRTVDDYAAAAALLAAAPAAGRRRRGQPVVPQPRPRSAGHSERHLRPRRRALRRGHRRHRGVRPTAVGQAQRQHRPHRRRRRGGCRRRRRGGDVHQHAARAGLRPRDAPAGARRGRRRAVGSGDPSRSPCAPSTTCTPPCRTCRSSASAAWPSGWDAEELLLAGAVAVQVGTATFADPRAPARCSASSSSGPRREPPGATTGTSCPPRAARHPPAPTCFRVP